MKKLLAVGIALLPQKAALAGPPFLTDDPETGEYQHYEIDMFAAGGRVRGETSGNAPAAEIDYGALPDVQLQVITSMAYDQTNGNNFHYGYGDTQLSVKYRFIDPGKDDWWPQVAIAPTLLTPTGDAGKGLGNGKAAEFPAPMVAKRFPRRLDKLWRRRLLA